MLFLRAFSRIKQLASTLGLPTSKVAKDLVVKHRKKLYSAQNGSWLVFPSVSEVIIPYSVAATYAKKVLPHKSPVLLSQEKIISAARQHLRVNSVPKLPIFVLLGHFNHGKTSLLDTLAGTHFVHGEGDVGITQSIRTREVQIPSSLHTASITLVDTPGQDIFYRMRNYGAAVAHAAILVVSAAPGAGFSEPQTAESIGIAESLGIPIVVVLNKIDLLPDSKQSFVSEENDHEQGAVALAEKLICGSKALVQLREEGRQFSVLQDVPYVPVSATTGYNIQLLKQVLAEVAAGGSSSESQKHSAESVAADTVVTGLGVALDTYTVPGQGLTLQSVLEEGSVQPGDTWASGGWAGRVRAIRPEVAAVGDSIGNTVFGSAPQLLQNEVPRASAGQGCRLLVSRFPESADPRPLGNVVFFYSSCHGYENAKAAALRAADEEAMREFYPSCAISTEESQRIHLPQLKDAKPDYDLNSASEAEAVGIEPELYQALIVKAASDSVLGTISDTWSELVEEGSQKARLVYCGVGNVTSHDVSIAQAAHATIVTIGVRVHPDALSAHVPGQSKKKRNSKSVGGLVIMPVKRVADVIDMLRNGWK